MLEKCVLTILELSWNLRLGNKKTKLNICHHVLTSSIQLQNRSFHVVERTRTSTKCQKVKNARAKRAKILFFIVKYANLWGFCCRRRRGCLSSLITRMVNASLSTGHFPDKWKEAVVSPLLKKGAKDSGHKNLRPVSNLQFVSKITERAVFKQIYAHVTESGLFPKLQSA